jgi:NAD(P)-dependent dehydrogenase (short-subunit alcohol dehydrogenase family)
LSWIADILKWEANRMKIKDYTGKTAYITGGSSGIGLACAEMLAARGANVLILARRPGQLETAIKQIENKRASEKQRFSAVQVDVSDKDQIVNSLSRAVKEFGPPDILINSAGISFPQKFEDIPFEKYDEIMRVNLYGTWNTISNLLPYLKQSHGYIINVSSVAGYIGVFGMTAYSAAKFAVIGFSEALRSELKRFDVTVSVLCPPDVDTPMLEKAGKIKPEETKAISASAKVMTAQEVAKVVLDAMGKGGFMILPGSGTRFTYNMKRLFPWLVESITDSRISKFEKKAA